MFKRNILDKLREWKTEEDRKPLVLRGARQVGKTTIIKEFSKEFDCFLNLNLDLEEDRTPFALHDNINDIVDAIFRYCGKKRQGKTLLFIDEIQSMPKAVQKLRYLYEQQSDLYVIAAGSLLETLIDTHISFPVGRVEYMVMRPCSFCEFLGAIGENSDCELLEKLETNDIHDRLMARFNDFAVVGGMPEAVKRFAVNRDVFDTDRVFDSLLISYMDDVLKYENKTSAINVLRYIIQNGWPEAGEAITFNHFANGNYKSAEVSNAMRILERALLLELVFPINDIKLPAIGNNRKRPKLIWLDTGLVNYFAGVRRDLFSVKDITDVWRGRIAEHIVAQELVSANYNFLTKRFFWNKDKDVSCAEVDFVYPYHGLAIPIEVKSGHNAKLKSLHIFMDACPHDYAVRVWSQPYSVDEVTTPKGKTFKLINIPFYLVGHLDKVLKKEGGW